MRSRTKKRDTAASVHRTQREERKFLDDLTKVFRERSPDFSATINIALVGKVSTGKSSLLNAILRRTRENPAVEVGATSGVTKTLESFRLHDQVLIIDSPGLDDVIAENSHETSTFLEHVDLGILVVSGSADLGQKRHYDDLKRYAKKVVVVLNKVDEWDDLEASALEAVLEQWQRVLGVDKVYPTVTKGFDPKSKLDAPLIVTGVDEVRNEIEAFFQKECKDIIFAHLMGEKTGYAVAYISIALVAVVVASFLPGSAIYITATQALAIVKLHYLYYGRTLDLSSALAALPSFAAKNIGMTLFIWAKSFLPLTGAVDAAAAVIAASITLAILATVKYMFANSYQLSQRELLQGKYGELHEQAKKLLLHTDVGEMRKPDFWRRALVDFFT